MCGRDLIFRVRHLLLLLLIGVLPDLGLAKTLPDSINRNLSKIDKLILNQPHPSSSISDQTKFINEYKEAGSPIQQYNALRNLFNYYRAVKLDSALIVADKRLAAANAIGDISKINSATLNLADIYSKIGSSDYAISLLNNIDTTALLPNQIKYLNSIYKTVYKNKISNSLLPRERLEAMQRLKYYRNQEIEKADKNSRTYLLLQAEELREAGLNKEAVAVIEELLHKYDVADNAPILYEVGETYLEAGLKQEAIEALSRSSLLDIENGTKEYQSLILLATILFEEGDINRAFQYINYALEDAIASNALIRSKEILKVMPNIYEAFAAKEREIKKRTAWFLGTIGILNIILIALIILLVRAHASNKRMIRQINNFNDILKNKNSKLLKADKLKLEHLKAFMIAYAAYISRVKGFRKSIQRLLATSQYQKALDKVKKEKEDAPDSNALQEMFDDAFLSMFPDFISEINSHLKSEFQLTSFDKLTPELRIAALMKMGISSTNEISEMFQYSPQSVYNLRSSLRNMLTIPLEELEPKNTVS